MLIIVENDHTGTQADTIANIIRMEHPQDTVTVLRPDAGIPSWERFYTPLISYRPRPRLTRVGRRDWTERPLEHIVCDGWHWSGWADKTTVVDPGGLNASVMGFLDRFLKSRGAFVVRIMDDRDPTVHGYEGMVRSRRFDDVSTASTLDWVVRYVDDDSGMACGYSIGAHAQRVANEAFILRNLHTYTGPPAPATLLLGNRGPVRHETDVPAFVPYPGTPGEFLADSVERILQYMGTAYARGTVGVANACGADSVEHIVENLHPVVVVPLGNAALAAYEKLPYHLTRDIRMFTMPHPTAALLGPGNGSRTERIDGYARTLYHQICYR
jgi:hypothetical protein